jgi:hypothetical protein
MFKMKRMPGNRLLLVGSVLCAALGVGVMIPAIVGSLGGGALPRLGYATLVTGLALILGAACMIAVTFGSLQSAHMSIPPPVRAVMAANVLFLAFCALEASDGLLYRGGRIVYWTSFLFLPALLVLCGQVLAQRWAWWVARTLTAISTVWFVGFVIVLPFANLRTDDGPVPWYGRLYMAAVSLIFAGIATYAFHSLGKTDARQYFVSAEKRLVCSGDRSASEPVKS